MTLKAEYKAIRHSMVTVFEDGMFYSKDKLCRLFNLGRKIEDAIKTESEGPDSEEMMKEYIALAGSLEKKSEGPSRIYLWPEGGIPRITEYTENTKDWNHDPWFKPYMYALLQPENVTPKGAIVMCAGGNHGDCVFQEVYGTVDEFLAMGYQCFVLLNRPNHNPWISKEAGVDAARAVRIVRSKAEEYRINPDNIAFMGFSNGGLTGEACIEFYSGKQAVADIFPGYVPDEYDAVNATPDAFVCVYGPRWDGGEFDWTGVVYPPVMFAIGLMDNAVQNYNYVYPDLIAHGVEVETHTFAAVPHGQAGVRMLGETRYKNFDIWTNLADAFMQSVFTRDAE